MTANSAMWVGETIADVVGYPLAGLFVVLLAAALPLAFWLDAATYLASAVLLGDDRRPARGRARPAAEVSASDPAQLTTGFVARAASRLATSCAATRRSSRTRSRRRSRSSPSGS